MNTVFWFMHDEGILVTELTIHFVVELPSCGEFCKVGKPTIQDALHIVGGVTRNVRRHDQIRRCPKRRVWLKWFFIKDIKDGAT